MLFHIQLAQALLDDGEIQLSDGLLETFSYDTGTV